MYNFKGVTPTEVNERRAQDFVGRIGPHILSISPGSVTANQHVLCITSDALAHQFQCDRYKTDFLSNKMKVSSFFWLVYREQDKI